MNIIKEVSSEESIPIQGPQKQTMEQMRQQIIEELRMEDEKEVEMYKSQLRSKLRDQVRRQYNLRHEQDEPTTLMKATDYKDQEIEKLNLLYEQQQKAQLKVLADLQNQLSTKLQRIQQQTTQTLIEDDLNHRNDQYRVKQLQMLKHLMDFQTNKFDIGFQVWLDEIIEFSEQHNLLNYLISSKLRKLQDQKQFTLQDQTNILQILQKFQDIDYPRSEAPRIFLEDHSISSARLFAKRDLIRKSMNNKSEALTHIKGSLSLQRGLYKYGPTLIR